MWTQDHLLLRDFVQADADVLLRGPGLTTKMPCDYMQGEYGTGVATTTALISVDSLPRLLAVTKEYLAGHPIASINNLTRTHTGAHALPATRIMHSRLPAELFPAPIVF